LLFGFFNTKSYFVVLWLALQGQMVHLPQLIAASAVSVVMQKKVWPLFQRALNVPPFPALFYNQHRLAHMPGV
jgi:hypothetical protein